MRIAIVGGVAGGASAAARARRLSETAEITIFERGPYVSFANCGLPYYIGREIPDKENLLVQTPESLKRRFRLDVRVRSEVIAIDRPARQLVVRDLEQGTEYVHPYDALILAPGAVPLKPPIPGIDRPGHFVLRDVPDALALDAYLAQHRGGRAVVVGGGYIGLEMAEQLVRRGHPVVVVEALPQVAAFLDPEMAAYVHAELKRNGVELLLGSPVAAFEEPESGETAQASVVVLADGRRIPADMVLLGMGVRPETTLVRQAGLELGVTGGIKVDAHLRTSDPHIWAVGDAIEVIHGVTRQPILIPLAGPANRQGRIAAENVLGIPSKYEATWGTGILRVFDLNIGGTGANERMLKAAGMPYASVHVHPLHHAGYYPGATPLHLKLIFNPETGAALGAQVIGQNGVDKRLDVLATAIQAGLTVSQIAQLELGYAPPFGSAKDPVNIAAMVAENRMNGHLATASLEEVERFDPSSACLLDVREPDEVAEGMIPGAIHIPLGELRDRLNELPSDREILVYCRSGQRSYFACRILTLNGRLARNLSGGYLTWSAVHPT